MERGNRVEATALALSNLCGKSISLRTQEHTARLSGCRTDEPPAMLLHSLAEGSRRDAGSTAQSSNPQDLQTGIYHED
jgi:hypothetical protein